MPAEVQTLSGGKVTLSDETLEEEIRMTMREAVITPNDEGYDDARSVENLHIDRRPGLIIRCSATADVIDAVNLARQQ